MAVPGKGGGGAVSIVWYIIVMAGVIPYAVLAAMTFPAVFYSTGNYITAAVGTTVALVLAYFRLPLIVVALAASLSAFGVGFFV